MTGHQGEIDDDPLDPNDRREAGAAAACWSSPSLVAAPALACGGLIGPNGAVNLLRTTTLAAYHDGEEHYITAFQFAGGGGAFGSLTPLPGIPSKRREGRRLDPPATRSARPSQCPKRLFLAAASAAAATRPRSS